METVCLKCLEKEAGRRYETARALAEDLRRYLKGEPITARPAGAVERGVKRARRRPAVAGLIGMAALVFVGLAGGGWPVIAVITATAWSEGTLSSALLASLYRRQFLHM